MPTRRLISLLAHRDFAYFAMIVLTFATFMVCAAIEFTPDAASRGPSPLGPVDDADMKPAGILTPIERK